jgi:hypothetical protein
MPADELASLIADVTANPRRFKADTVAARLGITAEIRTRLDLRTIGAIDERPSSGKKSGGRNSASPPNASAAPPACRRVHRSAPDAPTCRDRGVHSASAVRRGIGDTSESERQSLGWWLKPKMCPLDFE